jgi:hypothetical protein
VFSMHRKTTPFSARMHMNYQIPNLKHIISPSTNLFTPILSSSDIVSVRPSSKFLLVISG